MLANLYLCQNKKMARKTSKRLWMTMDKMICPKVQNQGLEKGID